MEIITSIKVFFIKWFKQPGVILLFKNGSVEVLQGKVRTSTVADIRDILNRNGVKSVIIYTTLNSNGSPSLKGTNNLPKEVMQRIRNVWAL